MGFEQAKSEGAKPSRAAPPGRLASAVGPAHPSFGYGGATPTGRILVPTSVSGDVLDDLNLGFSPLLGRYGAGSKVQSLGQVPWQVGDLAGDPLTRLELAKDGLHADILILRFEKGSRRTFRVQGFEFDIGYFELDTPVPGRAVPPRKLLLTLSGNLRSGTVPMSPANDVKTPTFVAAYRTMDEVDIRTAGLAIYDGPYAGANLSVEQVIRAYRSEVLWHELLCHAVPGACGHPFFHQAPGQAKVPAELKLADETEEAIDRIVRKAAIDRFRGVTHKARAR